MLGDMLGQVITSLAGPEDLALVEEIRKLSRARRDGDVTVESVLEQRISNLTEPQIETVVRAFTVFLDLANLAEDRHRVRVLRSRELERYPRPLGESIGDAIATLRESNLSPSQIQEAISRLAIELVFTAHPSEAKRRGIREKLARMRQYLEELDRDDLLPRETDRLRTLLRTELTVLWETEFLRPWRPTVLQEVERGLAIAPRLWEVVPQIYDSIRRALNQYYPDDSFEVPVFLTFGSWVGGDRDGHPDVTTAITSQTLHRHREVARALHLEHCRRMASFLTISSRTSPPDRALSDKIIDAAGRWPELEPVLSKIIPSEIYTRFLRVMEWRLESSSTPQTYRCDAELIRDIELMLASLGRYPGDALVAKEVEKWLDLARIFGLHTARLDIRQDARANADVMDEIFSALGIADRLSTLPEPEKARLLTAEPSQETRIPEDSLSPLARDTLDLFRLMHKTVAEYGPAAIGGYVISLTRLPSDVLTVLWLWRWAQAQSGVSGQAASLRIIPLFEKIADLQNASETLSAILSEPSYAEYLARQGNRQMIMWGYSDSTKDGGYLAACWHLHRAQSRLRSVAERFGVQLTYFHGRGGSLGRGGGPAARGILSLPPEALDGTLRLTEQGEVLAERYDDPHIAYRHLEQVTWATLLGSTTPRAEPKKTWLEHMDQLAQRSYEFYRELVDLPGFLEFFGASTPIDEIEDLPIGSRPARRHGRRTLQDLRAIPWVFSWTQNRCIIPAWYGLGTALTELKYGDRSSWQTVCEMYRQWPFFEATIDNAALALAKSDMYIGQAYAELSADRVLRQRFWRLIASERDRTRQAILDMSAASELLSDTPWLQASIDVRNPYIDPLNLIQIELLRRKRALPPDAPAEEIDHIKHLLRLTVQGVAAGMRTTG